MLQKFYWKNAVCTFGEGSTATGSAKIGELLAVLNGAIFDLETGGITCAFQATSEGGVLVMVSGFVSLRDAKTGSYGATRRFMQTFLLSRKDQHTYVIANDMHRFLGDVQTPTPAPAAQVAESKPLQPVAAAEAPVKETKQVPSAPAPPAMPAPAAAAAPASPAKEEKKTAPAPKSEDKAKPARQEKEKQQPVVAQEAAPAPAPPAAPPAKPGTYAAAAKASAQPANGSTVTAAPKATPALSAGSASGAATAAAPRRAVVASPPPGSGIFVANAANISKAALGEAFKSFGSVVEITTTSKSAKITFAEPREAEAVLAATEPIVADGVTLQVEALRQTGGSSGGKSRRGGGGGAGAAPAGEGQKAPAGTSQRGSAGGNAGAGANRRSGDRQGESSTRQSSGGSGTRGTGKAPSSKPAPQPKAQTAQ